MVFSDNQGLAAQINRLLPFLARPAGKFLAWLLQESTKGRMLQTTEAGNHSE